MARPEYGVNVSHELTCRKKKSKHLERYRFHPSKERELKQQKPLPKLKS